jgi:hypothetical protein
MNGYRPYKYFSANSLNSQEPFAYGLKYNIDLGLGSYYKLLQFNFLASLCNPIFRKKSLSYVA